MFMDLVHNIVAIFNAIPFKGPTWFVLFTLLFFVWLFAKADRDKNSPVNWEDLIIDSNNNRASPYKVGYLVGVIVGTWIVVNAANVGNLTLDIFGSYLTYLLGGASVNTFAKAKIQLPSDNGNGTSAPPPTPAPVTPPVVVPPPHPTVIVTAPNVADLDDNGNPTGA